MNTNDIKENLKEIEYKLISDYDTKFAEFVLADLYDLGQVEYIIDAYDHYLYLKDIAIDLTKILNTILGKDSLDNEHEDLLKKALRLKVTLDLKLTSNSEYNDDEVLMECLGLKLSKKKTHIKVNKEKFNELQIISNLHNELVNNALISSALNIFKEHFKEIDYFIPRIKWEGTEKELVSLFVALNDAKVLLKSQHEIYTQLITDHFINKNGKGFKLKQLSVIKSQIVVPDDKLMIIVNSIIKLN